MGCKSIELAELDLNQCGVEDEVNNNNNDNVFAVVVDSY